MPRGADADAEPLQEKIGRMTAEVRAGFEQREYMQVRVLKQLELLEEQSG